jgi:hypothetical protein
VGSATNCPVSERRENGKYLSIRRICASERKNKSVMAKLTRLGYESVDPQEIHG